MRSATGRSATGRSATGRSATGRSATGLCATGRLARLSLLCALSCEPAPSAPPPEDPKPDPIEEAVARLRAFEAEERAAADFSSLPAVGDAFGDDPYALVPVAQDRAVGILRSADRVVLYDADMRHLDEASFDEPTGIAWCDGEVLVVGERHKAISRFTVEGDELVPRALILVRDAVALRDVACGYAVDEATDNLYVLKGDEVVAQPTCAGPVEVQASRGVAVVRCLIDHSVMIGGLRIQHDGPIWSMALEDDRIALAGVENRPLDRSEGFFGNIDSFVFLYDVSGNLLASRNVSEDGIVTPKTLMFEHGLLHVTGYGSAGALWLDADLKLVRREEALPGNSAVVRWGDKLVMANPLLDGWVVDGKLVRERRSNVEARRLGEALVFTTLMAPGNPSRGSHSRFTCETCHFEGYVDGRTHHTGRGDVRATTKPLLGLFNNRPHFTRALDQDLTKVAHAEFRVAGKGSGHDPWFTLTTAEHPWLAHVVERESIGPEAQRRAVMRFLMAFNHRQNPLTVGVPSRFDLNQRRGAAIFAQRCEGCHAARLSTDDPATAVPFERWEEHIFDRGAIVWARPGYEKTGVTPYVHEDGARPSSLRRLYRKRPYFTNGSARTLRDLLAMVGFTDDTFFHAGAPEGAERLTRAQQSDLAAFLRLL